jgi:hypothetical protein
LRKWREEQRQKNSSPDNVNLACCLACGGSSIELTLVSHVVWIAGAGTAAGCDHLASGVPGREHAREEGGLRGGRRHGPVRLGPGVEDCSQPQPISRVHLLTRRFARSDQATNTPALTTRMVHLTGNTARCSTDARSRRLLRPPQLVRKPLDHAPHSPVAVLVLPHNNAQTQHTGGVQSKMAPGVVHM